MRIIAGSLSGRLFDSPHSDRTHPMGDKARGALFNILGDIEGLTVLDAFAGSGALSFEALSRGALRATAIDNDRTAQTVIARNTSALGLDGKVELIRTSAGAWLDRVVAEPLDIVLCDPPYADLQPDLLRRLSGCVKPGGILVLSWPARAELLEFTRFACLEHRKHGDATLVFYRRIN